jgi:hypothetical protein
MSSKLFLSYFTKKNFSTSLYSQVNLKFEKQFKFSTDKQYQQEKEALATLKGTLSDIKALNKKITEEKEKAYFVIPSTSATPGRPQHQADKAIAIAKLQKQLKNLNTKANELKVKLYGPEVSQANSIDPELTYKKEKIIRKNLAQDVFSSNYNFQNIYLNPQTYINRYTFYDTKEDKLLAKDITLLEQSLEVEIKDHVNSTINREIGNKSIDEISFTNNIVIKDSDTQISYDAADANTRLMDVMSMEDDFSSSFSEDKTSLKRASQFDNTNEELLSNDPPAEFKADTSVYEKLKSKTK